MGRYRGHVTRASGQQPNSTPWRIDRRTFIGAGLAVPAGIWLASCGGDDSASGSSGGGSDLPNDATIVPRYPQVAVPGSVRLPISFEADSVLIADGPDSIDVTVTTDTGTAVQDGIVAPRVQLEPNTSAFWVVRTDIAEPGNYLMQVAGVDEPQVFQVFPPDQVAQPTPGTVLPPFDTPTVDDARGVDPICTRPEGVCPLHAMTLTEALTLGRPVAYLISTPAHCQFGVCGPVLDILLDAHDEYGERVAMVHADVYTDDTATTTTPAVQAYSMTWEPSLFVADASGTIVDRLDISYSPEELREVLTKAGA